MQVKVDQIPEIVPMNPVYMPAIFGFLGAAIAGAFGASIAATSVLAITIGETIILTAASIGLGFIEKALIGKPKIPSLAGQQSQQITSRQAIAPWPVFYGRNRVGGTITYMSVTGTKGEFLNLVITLAGHQLHSIDEMFFDGVQVTNAAGTITNATYTGFVVLQKNLGTASQTAFTLLTAADANWSTNCKQSGRAGVFVQLKFSADIFPNTIPNITFNIKGREVFDPRSSTTGYSENPALCIRDYLLGGDAGALFGLQCATSELNDPSIISAANSCDDVIALKSGGTLSGGGNQRYLCNGGFTTDQKPVDILNQLLSSMAGYLTWQNGKWSVYAGVWRAPTVTLTDDDLRGSVKIQMLASKSDLANRIKGAIINPTQAWQPADFAPYAEDVAHGFGSDQWLTQDNGERIDQTIQLPFTIDSPMAQRIAKIQLERIRRQIRATWPCKLTAYQLQPADVVNITRSRYAWTNKTFEVTQCILSLEPDSEGVAVPAVDLSLRESDATVYAWNPAFEELADPSPGTVTLPNSSVVPAPTGVTLSTVRSTRSDGSLATFAHVAWTSPTGTGAQMVTSGGKIVIQFGLAGSGVWQTADVVPGDATFCNVDGVSEGVSYDFQIYSLNSSGASSAVQQSLNFPIGSATAYFTGGTIGRSFGKNILGNPSFETNTSLTPTNFDLVLLADATDEWYVSEHSIYHTVRILADGTSRSGTQCLLIGIPGGVTIPSDNVFYSARAYTRFRIPVRIGDILRISGFLRWDNDTAIPAGVTILQRIGFWLFDSLDNALGELSIDITNTPSGTYVPQQVSLQIPATIGGSAPSWMRVECAGFVRNNSGSALATGVHTYAHLRFDDMSGVFQNTAFDLTPVNTASTPTGSTSPLSQSGSSTTILVASSTFQFADGTVSYNSGSVNPGAYGTYYIYADDPTFSGGAVTYVATLTPSATVANNGRQFFGFITTNAGTPATSGTGAGTGGGGPKSKAVIA
jgi:hypothetical protein